MKPLVSVLLLVTFVSLFACGDDDEVTPAASQSVSGCASGSQAGAGDVARVGTQSSDLSDVAKIDCQPGSLGGVIRQGSLVETETYGMVRFGLITKTFYCQVLKNSRLNVLPPGGDIVAWSGTSGSSWCGKSPAARDQFYRAPNNVLIAAADPIFGVQIRDEIVIVKVAEGMVAVKVGDGEPITVGEDEQLTVLSSGETRRDAMETSDEDQEAIAWLRTVIVSATNQPTETASPVPGPDLVIEDVEPEHVLIEESCLVQYVVANLGTTTAEESLARVSVNGLEVDEKIPALTAGESSSFETLVGPTDCQDEYEVRVVADVDATVEESDESNNVTMVAVQ